MNPPKVLTLCVRPHCDEPALVGSIPGYRCPSYLCLAHETERTDALVVDLLAWQEALRAYAGQPRPESIPGQLSIV